MCTRTRSQTAGDTALSLSTSRVAPHLPHRLELASSPTAPACTAAWGNTARATASTARATVATVAAAVRTIRVTQPAPVTVAVTGVSTVEATAATVVSRLTAAAMAVA